MAGRRYAGRAITLLLALLLSSGNAFAQQATKPPKSAGASAVEKGRQGVELYEQGNWQEALNRFQEAEALYHSPVFLLYSARSLRKVGRLQEAKALLTRLTVEQLDATAPEPWKQAQTDGGRELQQLQDQISAEVVPPQRPRQLPQTPKPTPAAKLSADPVSGRAGVYIPGLAVTSVGGVALAAGGVVGILALDKRSTARTSIASLKPICRGTQCLDSHRGEVEPSLEHARKLALAADVLWISGAALAAVGVVLMLIDPRAEPTISGRVHGDGGSLQLTF